MGPGNASKQRWIWLPKRRSALDLISELNLAGCVRINRILHVSVVSVLLTCNYSFMLMLRANFLYSWQTCPLEPFSLSSPNALVSLWGPPAFTCLSVHRYYPIWTLRETRTSRWSTVPRAISWGALPCKTSSPLRSFQGVWNWCVVISPSIPPHWKILVSRFSHWVSWRGSL